MVQRLDIFEKSILYPCISLRFLSWSSFSAELQLPQYFDSAATLAVTLTGLTRAVCCLRLQRLTGLELD